MTQAQDIRALLHLTEQFWRKRLPHPKFPGGTYHVRGQVPRENLDEQFVELKLESHRDHPECAACAAKPPKGALRGVGINNQLTYCLHHLVNEA